MKTLFLTLFIFVGGCLFAQTTQDVALIQARFGKDKQTIVKEFMDLSPSQDSAFWPLYDAYEKDRQSLMRDRLKDLSDYAGKFHDLNDKSAQKVMSDLLSNDAKLIALESKYLGKMSKAIGGMKAASFFQLESYLRNTIFSKLQEKMPSIESLVK